MRAAVIASDQVTVETVPDPQPAAREVVLAVAGCGICGTDLHIADGQFAPTLPVVPGHEFAGEVVAVGADVDEVCGSATRWPSTRRCTATSATSAGAAAATSARAGAGSG